jgi:hypothetical protein
MKALIGMVIGAIIFVAIALPSEAARKTPITYGKKTYLSAEAAAKGAGGYWKLAVERPTKLRNIKLFTAEDASYSNRMNVRVKRVTVQLKSGKTAERWIRQITSLTPWNVWDRDPN